MSQDKSILYEDDYVCILDYSERGYVAFGVGSWSANKEIRDKVKAVFLNEDIKGKYGGNFTFEGKTIKGYTYSKKTVDLDKLIDTLVSGIKRLRNKYSEIFNEKKSNTSANDDIKDRKIEKLRNKNRELVDELEELDERIIKLEKKNDRLKEENESLKKKNDFLNQKLKKYKNDLEKNPESYKYLVGVPSMNSDDEEKVLNLVIEFKNTEVMDEIVDNGFDSVIGELNKVIKEKYGPEWNVNDVPELDSVSDKNPDITL